MKNLLKTKNLSVKDYIIKTAIFSSLFIWLLGRKTSDFLTSIVNLVIDPLFSVDLNKNGEPDLKELEKFTIMIGKKKIHLGKIILECIKLIFHLVVIYLFIYIILHKTDFITLGN